MMGNEQKSNNSKTKTKVDFAIRKTNSLSRNDLNKRNESPKKSTIDVVKEQEKKQNKKKENAEPMRIKSQVKMITYNTTKRVNKCVVPREEKREYKRNEKHDDKRDNKRDINRNKKEVGRNDEDNRDSKLYKHETKYGRHKYDCCRTRCNNSSKNEKKYEDRSRQRHKYEKNRH